MFFPGIQAKSAPAVFLGVIVALVLHSAMYVPQGAFVAEQFSARLRYTGSSLAYTLGGATAPLLFTALLAWTGSWPALAAYLGVTAVVTVIGLVVGRDPLPDA